MSLVAYNSLSEEDKSNIDDLLRVARPLAAEISKLCTKMQTVVLDYNENVQSVLSSLQDTDEIPNKTGLSDAKNITKLDLVDFIVGLDNVNTTYNTSARRTRWVKMAGINANI